MFAKPKLVSSYFQATEMKMKKSHTFPHRYVLGYDDFSVSYPSPPPVRTGRLSLSPAPQLSTPQLTTRFQNSLCHVGTEKSGRQSSVHLTK